MFEFLYHFFAVIFGYIMNVFYMLLDLLGTPYLWLCIVLFSIATRLIFLPQKIGSIRKSLLAPAVDYDKKQLRKQYGSVSKNDKERYQAYKKDIDLIYKKYRVSSGSGCLTALLQFPVLIGLFRVVKEPFQYVPQLSVLTDTQKANVNNFFGLSLEQLPQDFGGAGIIIPVVVLICTSIPFISMLLKKKKALKPIFIIPRIMQIVLLVFMSFCVPIAISLYWSVNNLTNITITAIINKILINNRKIQETLKSTAALVAADELNNTNGADVDAPTQTSNTVQA